MHCPRTRSPFALALLFALAPLVADAGPRAAPQARPQEQRIAEVKPGDTVNLHNLDFGRQLARLKVSRDPVMSAYALMALRRFADGTRSNDPVDKAVARVLGRMKNGRKIAKRIVGRIDALPQVKRDGAFGKGDDMKRSTLALAEATTVGVTTPLYVALGNLEVDTLPAQPPAAQTAFDLGMSGIAVKETSDANQDGDGFVVMSTLCTLNPSGSDFVLKDQSAPADGALDGLTAGEVVPLDRPIYSGTGTFAGLLTTAAFEVDDDAADARAEYLAMAALAHPLAVQLFQQSDTPDQKLARFAFALDYTIGLLALSQPDRWPQGALVKTKLTGYGTNVASLAATSASNDGGVSWKLAHTHDLPVGKYVVYFDVPATTPPNQKNVKVKVTRIESLNPEPGGDDLSLLLAIGGPQLTKTLPDNTSVSTKTWTVQRKVNPGNVQITLELWDTSPGPSFGSTGLYGSGQKCGDWGSGHVFPPCPDVARVLDLDEKNSYAAELASFTSTLTLNTNTGKITGDATGDVGQVLTLQGSAFPKGKVKVTVTVE